MTFDAFLQDEFPGGVDDEKRAWLAMGWFACERAIQAQITAQLGSGIECAGFRWDEQANTWVPHPARDSAEDERS